MNWSQFLFLIDSIPGWVGFVAVMGGIITAVTYHYVSTRRPPSPRPSPSDALHGSLAVLPLTSLLSMLENERMTGVVGIWAGETTGHLIVKGGELAGARCELRRIDEGATAVYSLLETTGGEFKFEPREVQQPAVLGRVTAYLLEAARRTDVRKV